MNFRELVIEQILAQLRQLVQDPEDNADAYDAIAQGRTTIIPKPNFDGVLRGVHTGPLEDRAVRTKHPTDGPLTNEPAPVAYVSWDGGRHDLAEDTFSLQHIVETLGIRIEILLDKTIGLAEPSDDKGENGILKMTYQVSNMLWDINRLVNYNSLAGVLHSIADTGFDREDYVVQDVVMEEWELDERFRGGREELLSIVFQVQVAVQKSPMTPSG